MLNIINLIQSINKNQINQLKKSVKETFYTYLLQVPFNYYLCVLSKFISHKV